MAKIIVVYFSSSGNTKKMAKLIADAIKNEKLEATLKDVEDVDPKELLDYDGIVIGSPTYYGTMAADIKRFLDDSIKHHGKLDGKVGAAFASAAVMGQETTVISILEAMLIHGMIVQGDPLGHHYGVISLGKPSEQDMERCQRFGQRFARLFKHIFGE